MAFWLAINYIGRIAFLNIIFMKHNFGRFVSYFFQPYLTYLVPVLRFQNFSVLVLSGKYSKAWRTTCNELATIKLFELQ